MTQNSSIFIAATLLSCAMLAHATQAVPNVVGDKNSGIVVVKLTNQSTGVFTLIDAASKAASSSMSLKFVNGELKDGKFQRNIWSIKLAGGEVVNNYVVLSLPATKDNERHVVGELSRGLLSRPIPLLRKNHQQETIGTFKINAGDVIYLGDYETADSATIGERESILIVRNNFEDAKVYLEDKYPELAPRLQQVVFDTPYNPGEKVSKDTAAETQPKKAEFDKTNNPPKFTTGGNQPSIRDSDSPSNEPAAQLSIKPPLPTKQPLAPAAAPVQNPELIDPRTVHAAANTAPASAAQPAGTTTAQEKAASLIQAPASQANAIAAVPANTPPATILAPAQPIIEKQGTWSYEVEKLANTQGCDSAQSGAWLVGKEDFLERYRVRCVGGKEFIAICDNLECKQM